MASSLDDRLTPGTRFGRYEVVRRLGSGGMGDVYEATHLGLRKPVALKVLNAEHARNPEARSRFLREGEAASRIRHPHVVDVTDVGMFQDRPYLVMEFLEGEDLATRLDREGRLGLEELVDLMLPVLAAVSAAHEEGVVHRDLKPENLFLARTRDGEVVPKVLDFGISRMVTDTTGRVRTETSALLGTPQHMSPEQARGEKNVDDRSDLYALGAILYEGATGQRPIDGTALYELLTRVVAGDFPPPRSLRPELPQRFEAVVLRAMATDPTARFESARAVGAALLPFASERGRTLWTRVFTASMGFEPTLLDAVPRGNPRSDSISLSETPRALDSTTIPLPRRRRRRAVTVAGALAVTVLVAAGMIVLRRPAPPAEATRPAGSTSVPLARPRPSPDPTPVTAVPALPSVIQTPPAPPDISPRPVERPAEPTQTAPPTPRPDRRHVAPPRPGRAHRTDDARESVERGDHGAPIVN